MNTPDSLSFRFSKLTLYFRYSFSDTSNGRYVFFIVVNVLRKVDRVFGCVLFLVECNNCARFFMAYYLLLHSRFALWYFYGLKAICCRTGHGVFLFGL